MRKTTTKKIAIAKTHKKAPAITGKRVIKPVETTQEQIDKAIKAMENDDKELELLERELKKPTKLRNKELMQKHGILDSSKLTDNYPDLNEGFNYDMIIHFPEDDGVKLEERPKSWFVGPGFEWEGNKFNFRFPIHYSTYVSGQSLYKLDGFNVYVDPDGVIKNDISDYTIFQALTDYGAKNLRDGQVNDIFHKYKIIKDDDIDADILNPNIPKNFAIRDHGLFVTSKVIKGSNAATKSTVVSGNLLLQPFERLEYPQGVEVTETTRDSPEVKLYNSEIKSLTAQGGIVVPGLTVKLAPGVLTLVGVSAVKSIQETTPRYVFLDYNPEEPNALSCYIAIGPAEGLRIAKEIDPTTTKVSLVSMIRENNKSKYNQYMGDIEAEKARLAELAAAEEEKKRVAAEAAAEKIRLAREKKKKEAEEKEAKRLAAEAAEEKRKAKEAAEKKAKEEAERKAKEEAEQFAKLLNGYKQIAVFSEPVENYYYDIDGDSDEDTVDKFIEEQLGYIKENGLRIPGITKVLKRGYGNIITDAIGSPKDGSEDPYFALLKIDKTDPDSPSLETHIYTGIRSISIAMKMSSKTPLQVVEALAERNKKTLSDFISK